MLTKVCYIKFGPIVQLGFPEYFGLEIDEEEAQYIWENNDLSGRDKLILVPPVALGEEAPDVQWLGRRSCNSFEPSEKGSLLVNGEKLLNEGPFFIKKWIFFQFDKSVCVWVPYEGSDSLVISKEELESIRKRIREEKEFNRLTADFIDSLRVKC